MNMDIFQAIEQFNRRLIIMHRPATVHYYQFYFKLIKRHLGNVSIAAIEEESILQLIVSLKKAHPHMKNITINKTLSALKTIIKHTTNITISIIRLKETKTMIPTIADSTITRILNHLQLKTNQPIGLRNYLMVKLLLETGLRMNEFIHLEKTAVDLLTLTIRIKETKTHMERIVCFKKETESYLKEWMNLHPKVPHLFYQIRSLKPLTTSSIESFFYQLKKQLNIQDNLTPHKWRHTFATQFLRKGGDLETLRMILGHSNLKTTQKYLHLNPSDIRHTYRMIMEKS